jgi:hypothetical protein
MSLTDAQLVDCRRYCGYGNFGQTVNPASGYRFMTHYGTLEYRLANLTASETTVVTGMLATLALRESEIGGAAANLDTDAASVWTRNRREVGDRIALYRWTRLELCNFFGVPPGPSLGQPGMMVV